MPDRTPKRVEWFDYYSSKHRADYLDGWEARTLRYPAIGKAACSPPTASTQDKASLAYAAGWNEAARMQEHQQGGSE